MLRLTLLAACLLVALQISIASGYSWQRYVKKSITPPGGVRNSTIALFKKGQKAIYFSDKDLPICHPGPIAGRSLALKVTELDGWFNFDEILIADDLSSANVTRKIADSTVNITIEVTC